MSIGGRTSTTEYEIPPYLENLLQGNSSAVQRATESALADPDLPLFDQPAPLNATQTEAIDRLRNLSDAVPDLARDGFVRAAQGAHGTPTVMAGRNTVEPSMSWVSGPGADAFRAPATPARDMVRDLSPGALSDLDLEAYRSPYTEAVTARSLAELAQQRDRDLNSLRAEAAAAGAFGGSRHGVAEGMTQEAFADAAADSLAALNAAAHEQAVAAAQSDLARDFAAGQANQAVDLAYARMAQEAGLAGLDSDHLRARLGLDAALSNQRTQMIAQDMLADRETRNLDRALSADLANQRAIADNSAVQLSALSALNDLDQTQYALDRLGGTSLLELGERLYAQDTLDAASVASLADLLALRVAAVDGLPYPYSETRQDDRLNLGLGLPFGLGS